MEGTEYDIVVMGTGITESILSGLLSMENKKILNIDKNPYYGDSVASLNLNQFWEMFKKGEEPPKELGLNRDWNIDLTPKFLMTFGKLAKMIIKTEVSKFLNWKSIDGSYVYQWQSGRKNLQSSLQRLGSYKIKFDGHVRKKKMPKILQIRLKIR